MPFVLAHELCHAQIHPPNPSAAEDTAYEHDAEPEERLVHAAAAHACDREGCLGYYHVMRGLRARHLPAGDLTPSEQAAMEGVAKNLSTAIGRCVTTCPRCGFVGLKRQPWQLEDPSGETCPCCELEFGVGDPGGPERRRWQYLVQRDQWREAGFPWPSASRPAPTGWSGEDQVRLAFPLYARWHLDREDAG